MRVQSNRKSVYFFTILGVCLVILAIALNVGWVVFHWRQLALLVFGVIFFLLIIAGLVLNTTYLVREIRRNEQHDSFINAVTHELKTPIASIRLYLETRKKHELTEEKLGDIGRVDIACVPIGGALSATKAAAVIAQLDPRIVVPMPLLEDDPGCEEELRKFLHEMGATPTVQPKLSVTASGLPNETTTVLLESRGKA